MTGLFVLGLQPLKLWTDPAHSKPDVGVKCLCNVHISALLMRCLMRCIIHLMLLKSYFTPRRSLDYNSFKQLMKLQALGRNTPIRLVKQDFFPAKSKMCWANCITVTLLRKYRVNGKPKGSYTTVCAFVRQTTQNYLCELYLTVEQISCPICFRIRPLLCRLTYRCYFSI